MKGTRISAVILLAVFAAAVLRPFDGQVREQCAFLFKAAIVSGLAAHLYYSVNKWVAAFLVLSFFSMMYPTYSRVSIDAFMWVFAGCVWYAIFYQYPPDRGMFLDTLCVIAVSNAVFIFVQAAGVTTFMVPYGPFKGFPGLMANPDETAALMAMCVPAFFRKKRWPWLAVVFASWVPAGSVMAAVVSTVLGLAYAAVLLGWNKTMIATVCAVGVLWILGHAVLVSAPNYAHRLSFPVEVASKTVPSVWVEGMGIGHWKVYYSQALMAGAISEGRIRMHNTIIQGWVEMGILFMVVLTGYLLSLARRIKKDVVLAMAFVAIFVCANVNSMLRMNAINAMLSIAWLAYIDKETA